MKSKLYTAAGIVLLIALYNAAQTTPTAGNNAAAVLFAALAALFLALAAKEETKE